MGSLGQTVAVKVVALVLGSKSPNTRLTLRLLQLGQTAPTEPAQGQTVSAERVFHWGIVRGRNECL